ncbi:11416_t:CDS:2, partial [Funneliformis caledonium]
MSDESLSLRHQRALEILQDPEFKKYFEDIVKKFINRKVLKEWIEAGELYEEDDDDLAYFEYKKSEARKNGVNSGSVSTVTESRPVGIGGCNSPNGEKQNIGSMSRIYPNCDQKSGKESSTSTPASKQSTLYKNNKHR